MSFPVLATGRRRVPVISRAAKQLMHVRRTPAQSVAEFSGKGGRR